MKYWYLKNGDILGPMTAEEIVKDDAFAEDSLVCPEDKAEQAEFWKTTENYSQDFAAALSGEEEMEIPEEVSLDDTLNEPVQSEEQNLPEQKEPEVKEEKKETNSEEKNPFETDRPKLVPDFEDTFSSHAIAPRLDADGDTLLEDIPAKAILGQDNQEEVKETPAEAPKKEVQETKEENKANGKEETFPTDSLLAGNEDFDDAPILNIFERPYNTQRNKTREITDISENIYDKYGADKQDMPIHMSISPQEDTTKREQTTKNKKIYLLLVIMFIVVIIAIVFALFGTGSEKETKKEVALALPNATEETQTKPAANALEIEDTPTIDASAFLAAKTNDVTEEERALKKVKIYPIKSTGEKLGDYLDKKYDGYQTSWTTNLLSGRNYCVHFNARKIRQEPIVYSFSIDLDKNVITGLNNLGMDLLFKGE